MSKALVIVESPTKARTINRFLEGDDKPWDVEILSSMGHIRDLPESSLGVDVNDGFTPAYVLTRNGKRVLRTLRSAVAKATDIYLATDPDREGEAIAWHLSEVLAPSSSARFHRISFHEVTKSAIAKAFENPGVLDTKRVDAQQARRVLDRLVGYQISPLLWKEIQKGTSAGRVQSVALRLACERERSIQGFVPTEYWNLAALFDSGPHTFRARLALLDGKRPQISDAQSANAIAAELGQAAFRIARVEEKPRRKSAAPPFITSTLQQAASGALRLSTSQTMRIAQQLYEGIELGDAEASGLITYMRTDSVEVASEAQLQARQYIMDRFGVDFAPEKPNVYKSRKTAQEAHEAIRPTDVTRTPDAVEPYLTQPQLRLYRLVWNRFVASQMTPATFLEHIVEVEAQGQTLAHTYLFRATDSQMTFAGHLAVYNVKEPDQEREEEPSTRLPQLASGSPCELAELDREQCFTEPLKRYSEATLVRELEENGVGRPSTYATTVNTIQERDYVLKQKGRLVPSELGFKVNDFLIKHMPKLLEVDFTARMESQLDEIEEGRLEWTAMLRDFHEKLQTWLKEDAAVSAAPASEKIALFMEIFPDDLNWVPPVTRGSRTYDDRKFFESLRTQLEARKRVFSDRQWVALLGLAVRYADQIPGLLERAEELGVLPKLKELLEEAESQSEEDTTPDPVDQELLACLANVEWAPPAKRGRRTFNDRKFYRSLARQVQQGSRLTNPQRASLKRLISKYHTQIEDFDQLSHKHGIEIPDAVSEEHTREGRELLELTDSIQNWDTPRRRGKRVYDDREFTDSLRQQFGQRQCLSSRQLDALRRMLSRYRGQIPDYEKRADALGLPQD